MGTKLTIQKWGNSAAVRLPASMLAQLGVRIGDSFEADVGNGGITLRASKPRYKLADLIALCDPTAPPPADMAVWEAMPSVRRPRSIR